MVRAANSALWNNCSRSSVAWTTRVGARTAAILAFGSAARLSNAAPAARGAAGFMRSMTSSTSARCSGVRAPMTASSAPISAVTRFLSSLVTAQYSASCLNRDASVVPLRSADCLGGLRRRRDPARDQRERRDALGVQGREEQRGRAAVRQGDDGGLPHAEVVEQPGVGMRLLVEGGALAEGRTQVAEAGGRDPAVSVAEQRPRDELALIVAAAASVDHEHGRARSARGVLDVAVG